jgi:hypothetical protein
MSGCAYVGLGVCTGVTGLPDAAIKGYCHWVLIRVASAMCRLSSSWHGG